MTNPSDYKTQVPDMSPKKDETIAERLTHREVERLNQSRKIIAEFREKLFLMVMQMVGQAKSGETKTDYLMDKKDTDRLKNDVTNLAVPLVLTALNRQREELFNEIHKLAPTQQFKNWSKMDIANFFVALGELERNQTLEDSNDL